MEDGEEVCGVEREVVGDEVGFVEGEDGLEGLVGDDAARVSFRVGMVSVRLGLDWSWVMG
jgi:hypothetical protein